MRALRPPPPRRAGLPPHRAPRPPPAPSPPHAPPPAALFKKMADFIRPDDRKSGRRRDAAKTRVPLKTRWRAVTGTARERVGAAWAWTLALPGISHALAAAAAVDAATAPARAAVTEVALDTRSRYRKWRAAETRAQWAWENATPAAAAWWHAAAYNALVFAMMLPYMALCPAHWSLSVALPFICALILFDHPLFNPIVAAMGVAGVAGKWRPGLLTWALGV